MWLCTTTRVGRSCFGPEGVEGPRDRLGVVGVRDRGDVPAVGDEACRHVLGERDAGVALDRHPVRVVDPAQVRQPQVARQGGGLGRDALHHAAVPGQGVDVEVEQRHVIPVVAPGQPAAGDRHAHRGRHPLAQRPGGGLDAAGPAVLGMARAAGAELAEGLQVLQRDRGPVEHLVVGVHRLDAGSGAAATTAARRRGPRTARTGPGSARSGRRGRSGGSAATACTRPGRRPSGCRGGRSSPAGSRPCTAPGWC